MDIKRTILEQRKQYVNKLSGNGDQMKMKNTEITNAFK